MVTVPVLTSDRRVWNLPEVLISIVHAMSCNQDITINLQAEGPDFDSLELTEPILQACELYSYDPKRITLFTANLMQSHNCFAVQKFFAHHLADNALEYDTVIRKRPNMKHFGFFVGRNNALRAYLGSVLQNRFHAQTLHINHFCSSNEFAMANIGLEDLMRHYNVNDIGIVAKYLQHCPISADVIEIDKSLDRNHAQQLLDHDREKFVTLYNDFFLELVCETYFTGETFFPTEKIWRPMLLKTPFIVQGPTKFLQRLRSWGFKTFDFWWDEGYDDDPPSWSMKEIVKLLDSISLKDPSQLADWYQEMQPVLEHNRNRFLEICHDQKRFPFTG